MRHFLIALLFCGTAVAQEPAAPAVDLLIAPHSKDGKVDYVDVTVKIAAPRIAADKPIVRLPLVVASIPSTRYDGDALKARDAKGALKLTIKDAPPTSFLEWRKWHVGRATEGDVVITGRATPRQITGWLRGGPLFDLREEAGGMLSAGWTFVPVPEGPGPRKLSIRWDLKGMPAGSKGVWSLGEGDVNTVATADLLAGSYYAAGPLKQYPNDPASHFAVYWLTEPSFDPVDVATHVEKLYAFMAKFYEDPDSSYRVFIRKNPFNGGGGGTALAKSFMFGYSDASVPTTKSLQGLLAHEMVHNWPTLTGDHGDTSWYTEGSAEYYSILLQARAGVTDLDEFLKSINARAAGYYTNTLNHVSNAEAEDMYWKDRRAERIPYARGFMYLLRTDALVRAKSKGARSLDTLELDVLRRQRAGEVVTPDTWAEIVTAELGPQGKQEYADMVAGKLIAPPDNAFGPCFKPMKAELRPWEPGFDPSSLQGENRIIKGLVAGSPAAQAGLMDGDEVAEATAVSDLQSDSTKPMVMKVRRGGELLDITYIGQGRAMPGYQWVRVAGVPDSACKL